MVRLAQERGVRLGIVEHAGTKENKYPVVLSTDDELKAYLKMLDGKGVYKGVQAEWTDWMTCFSPAVLAQLDYVLTDAMTFPGRDGQRVKLWEKAAEQQVDMHDHERFMDRFVDWHVEIMSTEPFDILANASWLPDALIAGYDDLWTERRIQKVLDAALEYWDRDRDQFELQAPQTGVLETGKGCRRQVQLRIERPLSQDGAARLQHRHGEDARITGIGTVRARDRGHKAVQRRKP